jgi:hypothetical protein
VLRKQSLVLGGTEARETVRWLFNEYANTTASVAALARSLNARQVRTVEGGAWHETTVYRILTSPVYCGHMAKRRKLAGVPPVIIARDTHDRLIEQALFDRVQHRLTSKRRSGAKRRPDRCASQYPDLQPEDRERKLAAKLERMMTTMKAAPPPEVPRKRRIGTGSSAAFRRRRRDA